MDIVVRRINDEDRDEWFQMRKGIWPEAPDEYLRSDMGKILAGESDVVFMAFVDNAPAGMIEVHLREYGEGCETSPVGYIESWFVYNIGAEEWQAYWLARQKNGRAAGAVPRWLLIPGWIMK